MTLRHIAAVVVAGAALAGCSPTSTDAGSGAPVAAPNRALAGPAMAQDRPVASGAPAAAPNRAFAGPDSSNGATTGIVVGTPPSSDIERSVTAAYTVPAGSFLSSFDGTIARAVGLGGYVASSNTQPDSSGRIVSGSVTLKVPAAKIADFLNGMPSSFVASSINFSAIDHTAQFIDVNARLASARAHLAALDALLAKATSIADITNLQQQIQAVQTEVDTDQGEMNVLTASVELATATVEMAERGTTVATPQPNPVTTGLGGGWDNAVHLTGAALEGVVSVLPLLVVLFGALVVWRRLARTPVWRRRSDTAAK